MPQPVTRVVECSGTSCGDYVRDCLSIDPVSGTPLYGPPLVTLTLVNGRWVKSPLWCPGGAALRRVSVVQAVREQVVRWLPGVGIGSAWSVQAIVNAEVVLWADTAVGRELVPGVVVGRRVRVRLRFVRAEWDFGDGSGDVAGTPGRPYDKVRARCATAQCPGYYGHTYLQVGRPVIRLRVSWRAEFSLDGGAWVGIPGLVTGPVARRELVVVEARGVLVPD